QFGPDTISARQDRVALTPEVPLEIDVAQFVAACESRDDARAIELYSGPLLDGVHISDAPEFDLWVSRERSRLERLFLEACERHIPSLIRGGAWDNAFSLAERWLLAAPSSAAAFVALLRARASTGSIAALTSALGTYDRNRRILAESYDIRPDASVIAHVDRLRQQLAAAERESANVQSIAAPPIAHAHDATQPTTHRADISALDIAGASHVSVAPSFSTADKPSIATPLIDNSAAVVASTRSHRWRWTSLSAIAATIVAALFLFRHRPVHAEPGRAIVAVAAIDNVDADSSVNWLRAGLPRMIANDLSAMGGIEVVAPGRVRDVIVRVTGSSNARVSQEQATDVARRVGATWVVTGGVSNATNGYLLDLTMRSVGGSVNPQSFTILAASPVELGRMAAARLATVLNASANDSVPRFSGVETNSPDAYHHFIRGMLASDAERLADAATEFDAAIALDSSFVMAIRARRSVAHLMGDDALDRRLAPLEQRYASRLSDFDRLSDEVRNVDTLGEHTRAAALADQLLTRYPHDPRAYNLRAGLYEGRGQWASAETTLVRELALDSLAIVAGDGPCTPCEVLWSLSQVRLEKGDAEGAVEATRRWVSLQPDFPGAWRSLSSTLAAAGHANEAVDAGFHYIALTQESPALVEFVRNMIVSRRYDIADSMMHAWKRGTDPVLLDAARDLSAILMRERGQFVEANAELANLPFSNGLILERADGLARTGHLAEARAIYETAGHPPGSAHTGQFTAPEARGFTWSHALEADALVRAGDTTHARALIDSLAIVGRQSYYMRDWVLNHHVRGLLLYAEGKYADAEREFRAGEWTAAGWTRTNVELARAELAQGHASDAIAALRDAHTAPLNAMGRYVPHSEIDWWLTRAFLANGQRDSALVYAGYLRDAWKHADAPIRARLDSLPR
ncbi:MAG TPA: BTAD domain-containing putative transcriptional regulator, partial [Gemmatimonadaceae bacterium]